MGSPLTWWDALPERLTQIILGLLIGTAARYGLSLNEGEKVTARMLISDLLLQGLFGAIAVAITSALNLTGQAAVFVGAMVSLNGARIVRLARDWFFDKTKERAGVKPPAPPEQAMGDTLRASDSLAQLPPAPSADHPPTAAKLTIFRGEPRAAGVEALAEGSLPATGADFAQLLDAAEAAVTKEKSK